MPKRRGVRGHEHEIQPTVHDVLGHAAEIGPSGGVTAVLARELHALGVQPLDGAAFARRAGNLSS